MTEHWDTTVTAIVHLFRNALVALVPSMDAARIHWRAPNAYDDWEEIAACIFKNMVVRSIRWALSEPARSTFRMDGYDPTATAPDPRSGALLVCHSSLAHPLFFRRLGTVLEPFDTVEAWDADGASTCIPFEETEFAVGLGPASGQIALDALRVEV